MMPINSSTLTMNSMDISELVESRHDKVKQSIERLADRSVIELPPTGEIKTATRPALVYVFSGDKGKRDSLVVVAQLCPEFTARIVDRWQELERQQQPKLPGNYIEALESLLESEKQKQAALQQLEAARPAVEFVGRYVEASTGSMTFREVSKTLGIKENTFRKFLADSRIMYQSAGGWLPYANHVDAGRFEVKTGTSNGHAFTHPRFTAKGVEWVSRLVEAA